MDLLREQEEMRIDRPGMMSAMVARNPQRHWPYDLAAALSRKYDRSGPSTRAKPTDGPLVLISRKRSTQLA